MPENAFTDYFLDSDNTQTYNKNRNIYVYSKKGREGGLGKTNNIFKKSIEYMIIRFKSPYYKYFKQSRTPDVRSLMFEV